MSSSSDNGEWLRNRETQSIGDEGKGVILGRPREVVRRHAKSFSIDKCDVRQVSSLAR